MRSDSRGGLVVAILAFLALFIVLLLALPTDAQSPLTGSQVITLERGPDGVWLNQAWLVEWQARSDTRLAVIYDTWRHSQGDSDMALAYRQWDVSATYERASVLPWSVTAGIRWRTGVTGHSLGGAGPWEYVMVSIGW